MQISMYDLRCIFPATGFLYFFKNGVRYFNGDASELRLTPPATADIAIYPVQVWLCRPRATMYPRS
jgi:hypothetical protein